MRKKRKEEILNLTIAGFVVIALTGCNLGFDVGRQSYSSYGVKTTVAKSIDQQMEFIKPCLDADLQAKIDGGGTKGQSPLKGTDIVDLTLKETNGENYIGFCYEVNCSNNDTTSVLESARPLMDDEQFNKLKEDAGTLEKSIKEFADAYSKEISADQQEEFYNDLKTLVTKTVVMMAAGIVYMVIPDTVLWGKVSAAAAIAIGAGLVANITLTIYQKYRFGYTSGDDLSIKEWFEKLIEIPKAEFAVAAAAFATASTITENTVARGIIVCIFGLSDAYKIFKEMGSKYNFKI